MTKRCQKEKDLQSSHFDIAKELPDHLGYRLCDKIRQEISPRDTSTDDLLLLQNCMYQELCSIAKIFMTQYNTKQGLKRFSQSGFSAIDKEVRQLVTMDALEPYNPKELRREDCRAAMAYLMFLK